MQQMTPLQHAEYELAQIKKIKDSLMTTRMSSSDFEANGSEVYVFQELAKKYNEPCRILRMLWSGAYSPRFEDNTAAFTTEFLRMLHNEYHMSGTESEKHTWPIMTCLVALLFSPDPARQHPGFKNLAEKKNVPQEMRDELAEFLFLGSQIIYKSYFPSLPAKTLYHVRCKENYLYFMGRLEQDESSLKHDVCVLKIMQRENLPGLAGTFPDP